MPDMSVCGQFDCVHLCVCVCYTLMRSWLYSVTFSNFLSFSVLALFFVPLLFILVEVAEREVKESWLTVDQLHQLTEEQQLREAQ